MKESKVGVLSLLGLIGAYLIFRYPLFYIHRMKQWSFILMVVGLIAISLSGIVLKRKVLPISIFIGYVLGFFAGYFFQFDYGRDLNSMWIIWTCVYLIAFLAGGMAEFLVKKEKEKE